MNEYDSLQLTDAPFLNNGKKDNACIDICTFFPDVNVFLEALIDDIAESLLLELHKKEQAKNTSTATQKIDLPRLNPSIIRYYSADLRQSPYNEKVIKGIEYKIIEVWEFLKNNGLIIPNTNHDYQLSTKGKKIAESTDPKAYLEFNKYPWEILHPAIDVQNLFRAGKYADTIFPCFKQIEVRTRLLIKDPKKEDLFGSKLMRQAFKSKQEHSDLFTGAFTLYRNPAVHENDINLTPKKAWHQISLASLLLYELDELKNKEGQLLEDN